MNDIENEVSEPEYKFDIDAMPLFNNLKSLHQDGNYVVGITENGTRFSQRIPSDKMLSQNEEGEWCFIPLRGNLG